MRLPTAVAVALLTALFVGCNQALVPTSPSLSGPSSVASASAPAAQLSADVAASPSSRDEVPFNGTLEGRLTVSIPLEPPLLSNLIDATGTATQLGRFTLEIPHIVNTMTRMATGTYEFTAANGDTLVATFTGQATVVSPGVLSVLETATIREEPVGSPARSAVSRRSECSSWPPATSRVRSKERFLRLVSASGDVPA